LVNVALCIVGSIAMPLGHMLWPGPGLVLGFAVLWVPMMWNYTVWLPRIVRRRKELERREDPAAAARQRREAYLSWLGLVVGSLAGWGTVAFVLWKLH